MVRQNGCNNGPSSAKRNGTRNWATRLPRMLAFMAALTTFLQKWQLLFCTRVKCALSASINYPNDISTPVLIVHMRSRFDYEFKTIGDLWPEQLFVSVNKLSFTILPKLVSMNQYHYVLSTFALNIQVQFVNSLSIHHQTNGKRDWKHKST